MDAVVYYMVHNPTIAVSNVENFRLVSPLGRFREMYFIFSHSTRLLAATTLRNVLGTKNLSEILSEREVSPIFCLFIADVFLKLKVPDIQKNKRL